MIDLTTKSSAELVELLRTIPVSEWNAAIASARDNDACWQADLHCANLRFANLHSADLHSANLSSANLSSANLHCATNNGEPLTVNQWCDIFDMPTSGKGLRVAFKRLPVDRVTGRSYNQGKNLIEWKSGRWITAPDWNNSAACGGGLHLSPTAGMTRSYSDGSLCVAVAFDPKDAVLLGDKLKVRRCKVL